MTAEVPDHPGQAELDEAVCAVINRVASEWSITALIAADDEGKA
jgi:hypothetical protein